MASLAARIWTVTLALLAVAVACLPLLVRTGAPPIYVAFGALAIGYVSVQAWRSGGRFEFESAIRNPEARTTSRAPEIQTALFEVCERAERPVPETVLVEMDVPGAEIGYDDGTPLLAVDPRLPIVVGPVGLRAIFAHELGHLGHDIHTDAVRLYLPQVVGFTAFWAAVLAGRGPTAATLGSAAYLGLAYSSDRRAAIGRAVLSLGAEPLALAASRYANRLEEYRADAYAARIVSPAELTEALYRIAAIATGDNDEDVTGPTPWEADRSLVSSVFGTHPSIERRAEALDCELPAWVRPYRPHHAGSGEE
ncbi:M48 family metallopeptidase [Halorussus ruber]|uniref:M48 family metallopeptidase n=1 Tax=Halorussus ruber TaxID=1126238 RepID=UPI001092DD81|nr:M48 family metalloprotease [Halorussus ruber]